MRIENSMQVTALQPVPRPQPVSQGDGTTAPISLELPSIPSSSQTAEKDLAEAVSTLNEEAAPYDIALQFSRDEETGAIIIKMFNPETGDVLHQIPSEARLHLSAVLGKLQGQLFTRKA